MNGKRWRGWLHGNKPSNSVFLHPSPPNVLSYLCPLSAHLLSHTCVCSTCGLPHLFTSVLLKYISLFLLPLKQLISCSDQPPPQPLRVFLRCNKISLSWEMQWMHVSGPETSFLRAVECARGPDKWEMKNRGRWKTGCETPGGAERGGLTERTCRVHLGSNWRERSRQEQEAIKGQFKGGR